MIYNNERQLLNCKLLTWDEHLQNVAGFNMFAGTQPSSYFGQRYNSTADVKTVTRGCQIDSRPDFPAYENIFCKCRTSKKKYRVQK